LTSTRSTARQVGDHVRVLRPDRFRIKHDNVGVAAFNKSSPINKTEQFCRPLSDELHGALDGNEFATVEHVSQKARGEGCSAHAVKMRTGVGATDHDAFVVPCFDAHAPRLGCGPQDRLKFVGDNNVKQRVEWLGSPFGSDFTDRSIRKTSVLRREGVSDDVVLPVGESTVDTRLLRFRSGKKLGADLGIL
jgi:hypothetical protein